MSYILDALKKADQERSLGEVPDLEAAHWGERRRKRAYRWVWVVAALLLVNGILLYLLLGRNDSLISDAGVMPESNDTMPVTPLPRVEKTVEPAWRDKMRPREPVYVPPVAPARRSPPRVEQLPSVPPPAAVVEPTPAYTSAAPPQPAATSDVPEWNDLSLEFRSGLSMPPVDVHVYSDDPGRRFILMDLQKYREGETLGNGAVLEEILPDSIQLYYQGSRFRVAK
ncbi:MAG: general secretion pathway protein GspB [Gammaproteobacteria bacterium]|nr:general secretion pathway protein GspB [Gammaproteobacteria bacterium]